MKKKEVHITNQAKKISIFFESNLILKPEFDDCESIDLTYLNGKDRFSVSQKMTAKGFFYVDIFDARFPLLRIDFINKNGCSVFDSQKHNILNSLFCLSDKDYERNFIRKVYRAPNLIIQFVTAYQIVKHFQGRAAYICSSAVIMGYKAVEIGGGYLLREANSAIEYSLIDRLPDCSLDSHPRRNKEHLFFSLLCAQYHVAIDIEDKALLENVLKILKDNCLTATNYFTPSYPISLGLLMQACIASLKSDSKALGDLANLVETVFKKSVADSALEQTTLFQELTVTLNAALMIKKLSLKSATVQDCFISAIRIKEKSVQQRLLKKLEKLYSVTE